MVVLDSSILIKLFGQRVTALEKKKLDYLVRTLEEARERIIIPTPALAEYLARAGEAASGVLEQIRKRSVFYIAPFDQKAAVESALALNKDLTAGDKRGGSKAITWAKVKFDRQIVAIAQANGAAQIYSEDDDIRRLAKKVGISALSIADIDLPQSQKAATPLRQRIAAEVVDSGGMFGMSRAHPAQTRASHRSRDSL